MCTGVCVCVCAVARRDSVHEGFRVADACFPPLPGPIVVAVRRPFGVCEYNSCLRICCVLLDHCIVAHGAPSHHCPSNCGRGVLAAQRVASSFFPFVFVATISLESNRWKAPLFSHKNPLRRWPNCEQLLSWITMRSGWWHQNLPQATPLGHSIFFY